MSTTQYGLLDPGSQLGGCKCNLKKRGCCGLLLTNRFIVDITGSELQGDSAGGFKGKNGLLGGYTCVVWLDGQ